MTSIDYSNKNHFLVDLVLSQWGCFTAKQLSSLRDDRSGISNIYYAIRSFEKKGLIKAVIFPKNKKVFLKTSKFSSDAESCGVSESSAFHDCLVLTTALEMSKYGNVVEIQPPFELEGLKYKSNVVIPDFAVEIKTSSGNSLFAIELEVTQKSKERIREKYFQLLESKYDFILYVFLSDKVRSTYMLELEKITLTSPNPTHKSAQNKFMFLVINNTGVDGINSSGCTIKYKGELKSFEFLFKGPSEKLFGKFSASEREI